MGEINDVDRENILWELSKVLHDKMEHLSPNGETWESSEDERQFCYHCVGALVRRTDLMHRLYGWPTPNDDTGKPGVRVVATMPYSDNEAQADARLIAAAPDLLAALQAMYKRYSIHSCTEIKLAGDAIAKATGTE